MENSWTYDRECELARLWRAGHSARTIAGLLGGTTRNAVIGKANRLGLPRRASGGVRGPYKARDYAPAPVPPFIPVAERVALLDIGARQCRWPCGDPRAPDFGLCGRPTDGRSYCKDHDAAAYRRAA